MERVLERNNLLQALHQVRRNRGAPGVDGMTVDGLVALMIWCIRAPDTVDVIQDNLVYQLEPPDDQRGVPEWFNECARGFSREQRSAIVAYLDWYRKCDEARWDGTEPPRHVYNALTYWAATGMDATG